MSTDAVFFFPPRHCADFVVHYDNTAFHVHKFVLHGHSAYFRAYFQTLTLPPLPCSPSTAPSRKRAKRSSASTGSPAANDTASCHHPHIAHCIHLPQQAELVRNSPVVAAHFDLFLRHLYASSHYCYPPYLPTTDIDLDADSPPLCQSFPALSSLSWPRPPQLRLVEEDGAKFVCSESLMALALYLDCQAMMAQCEAVLLSKVEWGKQASVQAWLTGSCFRWLPYADRYRLQRLKQACIAAIASDSALLERESYQQAKAGWGRALLIDIMEAMVKGQQQHSKG